MTGWRRQQGAPGSGGGGSGRSVGGGSSRLQTKAGWVGLVPCELTHCPRERRRSESNRRIEVLQTSALPLGYGAGGNVSSQLTMSSARVRVRTVSRRRDYRNSEIDPLVMSASVASRPAA